MTQKTNLEYITSKLNYKNREEVIDLYTLRVRRNKLETRESALAEALSFLTEPGALANDN